MVTRAVSTWSLHRTLGGSSGPDSAFGGGRFIDAEPLPEALPLVDLPAALGRRGYDALQICHFHLPSREPAYLGELRAALDESAIVLDALLVDDGNLTGPDGDRAEAWIDDWLETAAALGAHRARVCAGRSAPSTETLQASADRLVRLAATHPDVRLVTENWLELLPDAESVLVLKSQTGDEVGLMIDLGNWSGPGKYEELARIAPLAETCHAKCHFPGGVADRADFEASLRLLRDAGYDGPLALIYDGPDDEWMALDAEWVIVQSVFG